MQETETYTFFETVIWLQPAVTVGQGTKRRVALRIFARLCKSSAALNGWPGETPSVLTTPTIKRSIYMEPRHRPVVVEVDEMRQFALYGALWVAFRHRAARNAI